MTKTVLKLSDGGSLWFDLQGQGEVICFVHGFSLDHRMWLPQTEYFSGSRQTLIYDLRGHGDSSLPTGSYSHHQDLYELLENLKLSEVHLVGHSLGGEIALDFTVSFPKKVKTLTLISSSLGGYESTVDWNVYPETGGIEAAKSRWLAHPIFHSTLRNEAVRDVLSAQLEEYTGWHWINTDRREMVKPSTLNRLKEITVPTVALVGENDLEYYHQIASTLVASIPNSKVITIPNVGHLASLEAPVVINNNIKTQIS